MSNPPNPKQPKSKPSNPNKIVRVSLLSPGASFPLRGPARTYIEGLRGLRYFRRVGKAIWGLRGSGKCEMQDSFLPPSSLAAAFEQHPNQRTCGWGWERVGKGFYLQCAIRLSIRSHLTEVANIN